MPLVTTRRKAFACPVLGAVDPREEVLVDESEKKLGALTEGEETKPEEEQHKHLLSKVGLRAVHCDVLWDRLMQGLCKVYQVSI